AQLTVLSPPKKRPFEQKMTQSSGSPSLVDHTPYRPASSAPPLGTILVEGSLEPSSLQPTESSVSSTATPRRRTGDEVYWHGFSSHRIGGLSWDPIRLDQDSCGLDRVQARRYHRARDESGRVRIVELYASESIEPICFTSGGAKNVGLAPEAAFV